MVNQDTFSIHLPINRTRDTHADFLTNRSSPVENDKQTLRACGALQGDETCDRRNGDDCPEFVIVVPGFGRSLFPRRRLRFRRWRASRQCRALKRPTPGHRYCPGLIRSVPQVPETRLTWFTFAG